MPRDQREIIAFHEAGHAAMAFACGFPVSSMSIRADDSSGGRVFWHPPEPPTADSRRRSVLVLAGGMAADALHHKMVGGEPSDGSEGHDNDRWKAEIHLSELGHAGLFDVYLVGTMRQLEKPDLWASVVTIADLLLKADHVDGPALLQRMLDACPKISDAAILETVKLADYFKANPDRHTPIF